MRKQVHVQGVLFRFGRIMALQSKQELFPGEEITVNYGYKVDSIFFVAQLEMISFLVLQISVVCIKSPLRFYLKVKDCMI